MNNHIKILHVEDSEEDAMLISETLKKNKISADITVVEDELEFLKELENNKYDIILSDISLPDFDGYSALNTVKKKCPEIPFIFVSGTIGEDTAIDAMRKGATDYVLKLNLNKLEPAVTRALKVAEIEKAHILTKLAFIESEEKYRSLVNEVNDGFFITDLNGVITFANIALAKIHGFSSPEELVGHSFFEFFSPDKKGTTSELFKSFIDNKTPIECVELEMICADGNIKFIELKPVPLIEDGKIVGTKGVISDITERKKSIDELIIAKEKAELSNKLKDAFIANVSHEIRTPLNGILGMTVLIENSLSKYIGKDEKEFFDAIKQANTRIVNTIDMILNYSRLQVGDYPVNNVKINLPANIASILMMYKTIADDKSVKLIFDNKCGEVEVIGDLYCLTQAVSNLIDNAIKYTNSGSVKLILYKDPDNKIKLEIQDTGIGISKEYLNMMYEPYSQEEIGYSRGYEGIGLGLSLVKKYLFLNGSKISVSSEKGKGTTFTISFERVKAEDMSNVSADTVISKTSVSNIGLSTGKGSTDVKDIMPHILIVEDDAINQLYMRNILKKYYKLTVAFSAEAALKKIESNKFALILMDISLKGEMNGLELTKILKKSNEHRNIPVIAVTGFAYEEDKQNCFKAGCNDFLAKPFSDNELLSIVQKFGVLKTQ